MVTQGNIAPDFTLETDRSEKVTLSKPRGSRSCSFYPKDDCWHLVCLLKTSSAAEIVVITDPNADRNKIEIRIPYLDEKFPCSIA